MGLISRLGMMYLCVLVETAATLAMGVPPARVVDLHVRSPRRPSIRKILSEANETLSLASHDVSVLEANIALEQRRIDDAMKCRYHDENNVWMEEAATFLTTVSSIGSYTEKLQSLLAEKYPSSRQRTKYIGGN